MKIVSDFDGVMTHLVDEGVRVREILRDELKALSGAPIKRLLALADEAMMKEPWNYGWRMKGRITAFANEDLFIRHNGTGDCLDRWAAQKLHKVDELLSTIQKRGFESFTSFTSHCYGKMLEETHRGKKPLEPFAHEVIEKLLTAGHELVIVSNSATDRILEILASGGIQAVDHDKDPKARFRVRGNAMKFGLGDQSQIFQVGKYPVEVDRPHYERILREEKPRAVIGDVFSLDLTLPLELAHRDPATFGGIQLFLLKQVYTPQWSQEFIRDFNDPAARLKVLESLKELPASL